MANAPAPTAPSQRETRPHRTIGFYRKPDNPGTATWRRNEGPRAEFNLPHDTYTKNLRGRCQEVATNTSTYIQIVDDSSRCLLWGEQSAVERARSELESLLSGVNDTLRSGGKGSNSAKWAKVPSRTPEAHRIHVEALDTEDKKELFRKNPLHDAIFESIGSFMWPKDQGRPQDVFGGNLEALDPIRIDCACFIIYDAESASIRAMGKRLNVQEAIVRLRVSLFQLVAREIISAKLFVLHWKDAIHARVAAVDYERPAIYRGTSSARLKPGLTPRGQGRLSKAQLAKRPSPERHLEIVATRVKDHIMQGLNKIKYYRGSVVLRVRLGTFLLQQYKGDAKAGYSMSDFEDMIKDPVFKGSVTQELGDRRLESSARTRMIQSSHFLDTQSTFIRHLADVMPVYTATLTLEADDKAGPLQLSKSWREENGHMAEASGATWHRLASDSAKCLLEACVVDLEDGLAWQFEMHATTPIPGEFLRQDYHDLGTYFFDIKRKEAQNTNGNEIWCEFQKNERNMPRFVGRKLWLDMKTTWQFGMKNSGYTVEVAKNQKVKYDGRTLAGPTEEATQYEARWTVQVVHSKWESNLAENANLDMGKGATWRADLETWFPMDDDHSRSKADDDPRSKNDGHVTMMEKLFKVQAIIRGEEEAR